VDSSVTLLQKLADIVAKLLPYFGAAASTAVGALAGYWFAMRKERWQRKRDFLINQLQLYGPAFALSRQMLEAYTRANEVWKEKRLEDDKAAARRGSRYPTPQEQAEFWERSRSATDTGERYFREVILKNASDLYKRLSDNMHLLDPKDVKLADRFFQDYNMLQVEGPGAKVPRCFIRPEFAARIEEKLQAKQREFIAMVEGRRKTFRRLWPGTEKVRQKSAEGQ